MLHEFALCFDNILYRIHYNYINTYNMEKLKAIIKCSDKYSFCTSVSTSEMKLVFIASYEYENTYDVYCYPYKRLKKRTVYKYEDSMYAEVFSIFNFRQDLGYLFKDADEINSVKHKILSMMVNTCTTYVVTDSNSEICGLMIVDTSNNDKSCLDYLKYICKNTESSIAFTTDILLLKDIAYSFTGKCDCFCNYLKCDNLDLMRELVYIVCSDLNGRGYSKLGLWTTNEKVTELGFTYDSDFTFRTLKDRYTRYIYEI